MNLRHIGRTLLAGGLLALGAEGTARATVLTFDIRYATSGTGGTNETAAYWGANQSLEAGSDLEDYGDNVASTPTMKVIGAYDVWYNYGQPDTPNVVVDYDTSNPSGTFVTHDGGGWSNRVVTASPSGDMILTFTPDAGYEVAVNSFMLDTYDTTTITGQWTLREDSPSGTIVATSGFSVNDPSGTPVNTGADFYGGPLVLIISGSPAGYLGLDDVNFEQQAIPEPASIAVVGMASLLALVRGRRRAR